MAAGRYDTVIEQGATFSRVITWKDSSGVGINLTGYTVAGKVKKTPESPPLFSFSVTVADQGTFPGKFTISLTATQTAALPTRPSVGAVREVLPLAYDIEASTGGIVTRILEGVLSNSSEVTK